MMLQHQKSEAFDGFHFLHILARKKIPRMTWSLEQFSDRLHMSKLCMNSTQESLSFLLKVILQIMRIHANYLLILIHVSLVDC